MNSLFLKKQSSALIVGAVITTLGLALPAAASTFTPPPIDSTAKLSTSIPRSEGGADAADIYYPVLPDKASKDSSLPVALLLQGALVDKSDYSNFASTVASYGFVVVVPNHIRTLINPEGSATGLFAEQQQVNDVLTYMKAKDSNSLSPINDLLDPSTLVLLGHSFGGAVGLAAIQGNCVPFLCTEQFERPDGLKGGVFYGTNFISPLDNDDLPIALVQGSLDGVATPEEAEPTYAGIQDPPKALITVLGANHYGITNEDNPQRDTVTPTLEQDVATETIARSSALFLRGTVLNDTEALDYVFNTGDTLDKNINVVYEAKPVPEPTSAISVLGLGAIGIGAWLRRKQKLERC